MKQSTVFNEAAVTMGLNPLNFPADKFPCSGCENYHHYTRIVLVWDSCRRGFLCTGCFWSEQSGEAQDELGTQHLKEAE